jgi:hypothetical protein
VLLQAGGPVIHAALAERGLPAPHRGSGPVSFRGPEGRPQDTRLKRVLREVRAAALALAWEAGEGEWGGTSVGEVGSPQLTQAKGRAAIHANNKERANQLRPG